MLLPPCAASKLSLDFASLLGPIFFTWLAQLMLPVMLVSLVYEKQQGCICRPLHPSPLYCLSLQNRLADVKGFWLPRMEIISFARA